MYIPSNDYLKVAKKLNRNPKSKIIIDGIEYTGLDVVKSYPVVSHDATKIIGEFPTKECKITIFNRNGNIDVANKDISVYRGLVLENGTVEYIPQGIFRPKAEDIKTNSTAKTIAITMKDKSIEFDILYSGEGNITYPCTISEFINEIVTRHGFILETPNFPFGDFILTERPNFDLNTTSERTLIAKAGELGGCITQMSRIGGVKISNPYLTGLTIKRNDYKSLTSKEKKYGPINCVTLGKTDVTDNIQSRDEESITSNGLCEWIILDNPYVDLIREQVVDTVAANIFGMSLIPFEIDETIDSYFYDINDYISIEDKMGEIFNTVILSISPKSRIFTKIKSPVQDDSTTDYNLAGSSKKELKQVKFDVDHVKNQVAAVIEDVTEQNSKIASVEITADEISQTVSNTLNDINVINEALKTMTETIMTQTSEAFQMWFQQTGLPNDISALQSLVDSNNSSLVTLSQYIRFYEGQAEFGRSDSQVKLVIKNDRISFMTGTSESAYISNNMLYITDSTILNKLQVGKWVMLPDEQGNLNMQWVGEVL